MRCGPNCGINQNVEGSGDVVCSSSTTSELFKRLGGQRSKGNRHSTNTYPVWKKEEKKAWPDNAAVCGCSENALGEILCQSAPHKVGGRRRL